MQSQCLPAYIPPCKIQQFAQQHPEKVFLANNPKQQKWSRSLPQTLSHYLLCSFRHSLYDNLWFCHHSHPLNYGSYVSYLEANNLKTSYFISFRLSLCVLTSFYIWSKPKFCGFFFIIIYMTWLIGNFLFFIIVVFLPTVSNDQLLLMQMFMVCSKTMFMGLFMLTIMVMLMIMFMVVMMLVSVNMTTFSSTLGQVLKLKEA